MATNSGSSNTAKTVTTAVFKQGKGIPGIRRVITKKDAKAAWGVDLDNDLVWDRTNGHTVDVSALPEEAKAYLKNDKSFTVREEQSAS